ncbi:MAG TPA: galactokinase [Myxococcota bacterium]|nr:galactokinase [Myxococcota bacterium]
MDPAELRDRFQRLFGGEARLFRAPGRVNLIGEHTDYNDGFVLPAAIDFQTFSAAARRKDRCLRIHSENLGETVTFDFGEGAPRRRGHWSDYPLGVAATLARDGHALTGADLLLYGEVPPGAGLSSSAALEVATALALIAVAGLELRPIETARLCQRAENEFVGTLCGIMDPFVSRLAQAGHALLIDCRALEGRAVPIPDAVRLVICNSGVRHALASGEYNARRAQCEQGVRALAEVNPRVRALRDATLETLEENRGRIPPVVFARCHHVVSENQRTLEAAAALERRDLAALNPLMAASHASLRDAYEVSCRELDVLVDAAAPLEGVFGARMTGGGFGGCTVNLVRADAVPAFREGVTQAFERATGRKPKIYESSAAAGASEL